MRLTFLTAFFLFFSATLFAQTFVPNYDESKIPPYTLPDPLVFNNGLSVKNKKEWEKRRTEILNLFEKEVYGITPAGKVHLTSVVVSKNENACNGQAVRTEVLLTLQKEDRKIDLSLLLFLPKSGKKVPLFLACNFDGNHTVSADPGISVTTSWVENNPKVGITSNKSIESWRGSDASSWPIAEIIARGYGVATVYYGDIDPDFDDGFHNGVHQLFTGKRDSSSWGSIAGWAWGLSRVMDYLVKVKEVNPRQVIVLGHSRLGKTALWAGATDKRFAMVVSNESGCGGAKLSKRIYGETVERINTNYPHWFCTNFRKYNNKEEDLPLDQHELLALIAPRPLYVCSAEDDRWCDPKGTFLSCVAASPVYQLLGKKGFPGKDMPKLQQPVLGTIGYHIRPGKHAITLYDWSCFMNFADLSFQKRKD
ncbi:MAG: acetylxylan esterase [Bacteroidia bacterium]|nr:acetylxylan esterase [Bacteroidia bacterium]